MNTFRRAGRPRATLPEPTHTLTARVRRLIDLAHEGRVRDASRLTGIPYPTLNDLYIGRTVNANIRTLDRLRDPYDIDVAWLLADAEPEVRPRTGVVVVLPPHPRIDVKRRSLREIQIPFAAWSMCEVFRSLEACLNAMEPGATRPIVAEAVGDALRFRLATFLLQPFLAAEKAGAEQVIPTAVAAERSDAEETQTWVAALQALGDVWRLTLADLIA